MPGNKHFVDNNVDMTKDEFETISEAFKNDEFKKLFFDYCEEIQNPESRKQYEAEIKELEKERGVDVTFLNPEPGFVVKTSIDGDTKCFINIAKCDKVQKPSNKMEFNDKTGKNGLNWSLPFAQAPPRKDFDNKGACCVVYDVLFHPDALHLAENNSYFRKHLIDTACDAVEREYKVQLDRTNLKYPKIKFKGMSRPIVVRKLSDNQSCDSETHPLDAYCPPKPSENNQKPKIVISDDSRKLEPYQTPKYQIKHRRGIDYTEMTYELDAKLNVTIPKELIVEIDLPMLKSTSDCTLDVSEKTLQMISEKPAKYKLKLELPYAVNDKNGTAKFDTNTRKLRVVLPVRVIENSRTLKDLYREDSGVESDVREDASPLSNSVSTNENDKPLVEEISSSIENNDDNCLGQPSNSDPPKEFLKKSVHYNFPHNFDCNVLDENFAIILHVKNVDPKSIVTVNEAKCIHVKFTSIGSGYYPNHYSFYFELQKSSVAKIISSEVEAWDNNVILTLSLENFADLKSYLAGLDKDHLIEYEINENCGKSGSSGKKCVIEVVDEDDVENDSEVVVSVDRSYDGKTVDIEIKPVIKDDNDLKKENDVKKSVGSKKQKKKNKKGSSLSESSCDDIKPINVVVIEDQNSSNKSSDSSPDRIETNSKNINPRKQRSYSDCRDDSITPSFKGILKRNSRYEKNVFESCSSIDDHSSLYSRSIDVMRTSESFNDIPEEHSPSQSLSESCKKTVRFNEVIQKQLFRLDSSILGQRKKNQKRKNQKQRAALQRRHSEGDSVDYEYNNKPPRNIPLKKYNQTQHDSGIDLSTQNKRKQHRNRLDSESSDFESKNMLMFDMEM